MVYIIADLEAHMAKTAKIFMNGRSQAVRLPKEFRFAGGMVDISRDPVTGNVILAETAKKKDWASFFAMLDATEIDDPDFMLDRNDSPPVERDLF
jgi:antitoxin VapB